MHTLFEEAGKFLAGRILSESDASLQVELDSGKRVKVKAAQALVRFDKPAPAELLKAGALEGDVIVVGEVVHAEHLATLRFGEAASDMVSDEAGGAGHEHFHSVER